DSSRRVGLLLIAGELREVLAVFPLLDDHPPVGQLDRVDRDVFPDQRRPIQRDGERAGGEERTVRRRQPFDREVLDEDSTGQEIVPARSARSSFSIFIASPTTSG